MGFMLIAQGCASQAAGPCPDGPGLRARVERVCQEVLPFDARVYFRTAQGSTCYCTCEALVDKNVKEVRLAREQRAHRYARNIQAFFQRVGDTAVHAGPRSPISTDDGRCPDRDLVDLGGIVRCGTFGCPSDERLDGVLEKIARSGYTRPASILSAFVEFFPNATECEIAFPWIQGSYCAAGAPTGTCPHIKVPSSFLRHPAVGEELIMFMLLHEIGHAVAGAETGFEDCEANADAWAIEAGFNAVYGEGMGEAVTKLLEQLDKYYRAVYPSASVELATVSGGDHCIGSYPKLACRLGLIGAVADVGTDMDLTVLATFTRTYLTANDCWRPDGVVVPDPARDVHCGDCPRKVPMPVPMPVAGSVPGLWFRTDHRFDQRVAAMCVLAPCLCMPLSSSCFPPALLKDLRRVEGEWSRMLTRLEKHLRAKPSSKDQ